MTNDQITVSRELLQQALEALEWCEPSGLIGPHGIASRKAAITALRTALERPAVEPVARVIWPSAAGLPSIEWLVDTSRVTAGMALYAAPQADALIRQALDALDGITTPLQPDEAVRVLQARTALALSLASEPGRTPEGCNTPSTTGASGGR